MATKLSAAYVLTGAISLLYIVPFYWLHIDSIDLIFYWSRNLPFQSWTLCACS